MSEGFPIVGKEAAVFQVLDFGVQALEGVSITTAHHLGDTSPCATIQRLMARIINRKNKLSIKIVNLVIRERILYI